MLRKTISLKGVVQENILMESASDERITFLLLADKNKYIHSGTYTACVS